MSWWVPVALVGAVVLGLVLAYGLTAGRPRGSAAAAEILPHGGRVKSRYEQDNEVPWNGAAFMAVLALVGVLVLVAVLIEVL